MNLKILSILSIFYEKSYKTGLNFKDAFFEQLQNIAKTTLKAFL